MTNKNFSRLTISDGGKKAGSIHNRHNTWICFLFLLTLLRQRFFLIQEYTTGSRGLFANCKHDSRNSGVYFYSLTLKDGPWKSQIERRTRLPIRGKLFANQTLSFFTFNNGTNNRSRSSFRDGCIFAGKQMNSTCNNEPCGLIMTHHIVKSSY